MPRRAQGTPPLTVAWPRPSDGLRRLEQVYLRAITALRKARREIEGAVELQHHVRDELINMLNPAQLTEVRGGREEGRSSISTSWWRGDLALTRASQIMAWFEENKAFMKLLRSRWHSKVSAAAGDEKGGDGVWWPREQASSAAKPAAGSAAPDGGLPVPGHEAPPTSSSTPLSSLTS